MENNKKQKKRINKKRIFIALLIVVFVVGIFFAYKKIISSNTKTMTREEIEDNSYNKSKIMRVDLTDIKSIKVNLETCDIKIEKSNTNPYIEYTNLYKDESDNAYEIVANVEDGNLDIKTKVSGDKLNMKNKIQVLKIFIPEKGDIDSFEGTVEKGYLKINDLSTGNIDLNVKSGNIKVKNSNLKGSLGLVEGNISLENSTIKDSTIENNTGNIKTNNINFDGENNLNSNTGDIIINTEDSLRNYNFEAILQVGNLKYGNIAYRNIENGFNSKESKAKKSIFATTKIGDIEFNTKEKIEQKANDKVNEDITSSTEKRGNPLEDE